MDGSRPPPLALLPLGVRPIGRDVTSILVGLRWLDVSGCGLRDAGAARVITAIASSRTLLSIDLSRNDIGKVCSLHVCCARISAYHEPGCACLTCIAGCGGSSGPHRSQGPVLRQRHASGMSTLKALGCGRACGNPAPLHGVTPAKHPLSMVTLTCPLR